MQETSLTDPSLPDIPNLLFNNRHKIFRCDRDRDKRIALQMMCLKDLELGPLVLRRQLLAGGTDLAKH